MPATTALFNRSPITPGGYAETGRGTSPLAATTARNVLTAETWQALIDDPTVVCIRFEGLVEAAGNEYRQSVVVTTDQIAAGDRIRFMDGINTAEDWKYEIELGALNTDAVTMTFNNWTTVGLTVVAINHTYNP